MLTICNLPPKEFVKKVRNQKNLSQEELASGICDPSVISRLESKGKLPPQKTLVQIIERLGYGESAIQEDAQQWMKELSGLVARNTTEGVDDLINKLENNKSFMASVVHQQFMATTKAAHALNKNEPTNVIMTYIKAGLDITIPFFHEQYINSYLLTSYDIDLLNQLAIVHWRDEQKNAAIDILAALVKYFDEGCVDAHMRSAHYPTLVYNLTKYMGLTQQHKEVIPLVDKAIAICRDSFSYLTVPKLMFNKGYCLYKLGDKDGSLHVLQQALVLYDVFQLYTGKERVKAYISENFNID